MITNKDIVKDIFEAIGYSASEREIELARQVLTQNLSQRSAETLLFVEDGSVNIEKLRRTLKRRNPEIEIVVYRQGSAMPIVRDL